MKIAIIGVGSVGTALAKSLVKAGHDVLIASRDPEDAGGAVASTGAQLAGSNAEAAAASNIVILAVPFTSAPQIASEIAEAAAGKTVVDVSNRMSVGPTGPDIDTTSSNAEELAALLPKSRVVKAFNTLFASKQHDPIADGLQLDGFLAGDDAAAKDEVSALLASIGLNPIDVGPLARARQLEGMAFLNISLNISRGGSWQSGWKLVDAPASGKAA